jgi:hypothetical protein
MRTHFRRVHVQIIYLDAFRLVQSSREVQNDHVWSCVNYLRSRERYRHSLLVYIPENAPGSRGGELAYQLEGPAKNSITMREYGKDNRPGVPKDPDITQNMVNRMRRLLCNDSIHLATDLSTYGGVDATEVDIAAKVEQLASQLLAFQRIPSPHDPSRGKWSGKGGVSGRDDLAVSALMIPYWAERFFKNPAYDGYLQEAQHRIQMSRYVQ